MKNNNTIFFLWILKLHVEMGYEAKFMNLQPSPTICISVYIYQKQTVPLAKGYDLYANFVSFSNAQCTETQYFKVDMPVKEWVRQALQW